MIWHDKIRQKIVHKMNAKQHSLHVSSSHCNTWKETLIIRKQSHDNYRFKHTSTSQLQFATQSKSLHSATISRIPDSHPVILAFLSRQADTLLNNCTPLQLSWITCNHHQPTHPRHNALHVLKQMPNKLHCRPPTSYWYIWSPKIVITPMG